MPDDPKRSFGSDTEIVELVSHIYWWWEADKRVEPETTLWRYMDLAKFLHLLETGTLFFSRLVKLGDPFEGASGILEREPEWNAHYFEFFMSAVRSPLNRQRNPPPKRRMEKLK